VSEPVLRPGGPEDDEGIAALIGEAFPGNPKSRLEVLRWQYRANPFGDSATWVWEDAGRIVGHYSAFPMPYLLDGERVVAGNAVDAAIAPSHQGRRLFTPMAEALYADCAARGWPVAVCYATNPVAMQGVARAGVIWRPPLRLLATPFFARSGPQSGPERAQIDELWRATVERDGIRAGVDRGSAWWEWRYERSPLGPYRVVSTDGAAAVLVKRGRFTGVLELVATDHRAARRLLPMGAVTLAVEGGPLHRLARRAGMVTVPRRLEPRSAHYGLVGADPPEVHVGWGDMDHV
jgi:hypothetical protein